MAGEARRTVIIERRPNRSRVDSTRTPITVAGPKAWNALPLRLRTLTCKDTFRRHLNILIKLLCQTLALFLHTVLYIVRVFFVIVRRH